MGLLLVVAMLFVALTFLPSLLFAIPTEGASILLYISAIFFLFISAILVGVRRFLNRK